MKSIKRLSLNKWVEGYMQIYVSGLQVERFFSILNTKNVRIWNFYPMENGYGCELSIRHIRLLREICKKTECRFHLIKKGGLPIYLYRHRNRYGLVLGLVLVAGGIYYTSRYIWQIDVKGTYQYTHQEIRDYITKEYIPLGTKIKDIDTLYLQEQIRHAYPQIAFIHCETKGTRLIVEVNETKTATDGEDISYPCNLVAAKDAKIIQIITRSGCPEIKCGEVVKNGQILVSGKIQIYNDYDEVLATEYVSADATIVGETIYDYEDEFPLANYQQEYTGRIKHRYGMTCFDKTIWLYAAEHTFSYQETTIDTYPVGIGDTYVLPISFVHQQEKEYTPVLQEMTPEEAKTKANHRLDYYLQELTEKGVEIIENNVTIEIEDGICKGKGQVVVWEAIERIEPISEFQEQQEEIKNENE